MSDEIDDLYNQIDRVRDDIDSVSRQLEETNREIVNWCKDIFEKVDRLKEMVAMMLEGKDPREYGVYYKGGDVD